MRFFLGLTFALLVFTLPSCIEIQRPAEPDEGGWLAYSDVNSTRRLLNIHATPFEMYSVSENEFFRIDANHKLIENRDLVSDVVVYGRPAICDNSFMRLVKGDQNDQVMEFYPTKTSGSSVRVRLKDVLDTLESSIIDYNAWTPGSFSEDGNYYLVPAIVYPDYFYNFFLFKVNYNSTFTSVLSVDLEHRIEVPQLPADFTNISSTRFVDGNFYVMTKNGTWRTSLDGETIKLNGQFTLDCFKYGDTLYMTGDAPYLFQISSDNGINWAGAGRTSQLRYVTLLDSIIVSQELNGRTYNLVDDYLQQIRPVAMSATLTDTPDAFYGMVNFHGRYYTIYNKQLYHTDLLRD